MIFLIVYLFTVMAAMGLGLLAGWSDYKGMTIPNYIALLVPCLFAVSYTALHFGEVEIFQGIEKHLIAGGVTFVVTFIMFIAKMIGGGDSKLATAFAFWVGTKGLPVFLFYMALMGALLGLAAIILKKRKPVKEPPEGSWVARVQAGESVVPYGIPIAIGAIVAFLQLGFFSPTNLSLFLMSN